MPRLVPAVQQTFGLGGIRSPLYQARLLSDPRIVVAQVAVIGLGDGRRVVVDVADSGP